MVELGMLTPSEIQTKIIAEIPHGWCGAGGSSLADVAAVSGPLNADHLEIGSLFGASAIAAAMAKQEAGSDGLIYCIDPMEYKRHEPCVLGTRVTKQVAELQFDMFWENVRKFGFEDRIRLVRKPSHPWPTELLSMTFGTAFIDGWHYGNGPVNDFMNIRERVSHMIILDDIVEGYPAVMKAFYRMCKDELWFIHSMLGRVALFRRRLNPEPFYCGKVNAPPLNFHPNHFSSHSHTQLQSS